MLQSYTRPLTGDTRFTYVISPDKTTLTVFADKENQQILRTIKEEDEDSFETDETLQEIFESMIANSELEWVLPEDCGALTSAPLLGIYGDEEADSETGRLVGAWEDAAGVLQTWYSPVIAVWGYAPYALRSPLDDLLETGKAEFVSSF